MNPELTFNAAQIRTQPAERPQVPIIEGTASLLELAQVFAAHDSRHALVRDTHGQLVGIVSTSDLQHAMRDFDSALSPAWHSRTVESLLHVDLTDHSAYRTFRVQGANRNDFDCVSVKEGADLVALLTQEDVLFSWNRLEPALSRAALDVLTQLPNRAHFERRFEAEWQRASRLGLSLGVIIIDVDHFKQINDAFGHLRGDLVLASVARCCQSHLRSYDLIARFAGDEFIALTCGCSADDIDLPIRRLQAATRELNLRFNDAPVPASLSIGAAVMCVGHDQHTSGELLDAADRCLYLAKEHGRDRAYRTELLPDGTCTPAVRADAEELVSASLA